MEQDRLCLAIAIAFFPGISGHLRQVVPAVEAIEQVANLLLNHFKAGGQLIARIAARRLYPGDLFRQFTTRRDRASDIVMRRH